MTPAGNWQGWADISVPNVNLTQANHLMRVFITNAGMNLNYVKSSSAASGSSALLERLGYPPWPSIYVGGPT
jgi:hypothetical protein